MKPPTPLILITYLGALILAPALGAGTGYLLDSQVRIGMTLGAIALLLGYVASLLSWYGGKSVRLLPTLARLAAGRPLRLTNLADEDHFDSAATLPGSILFLPICGLIGAGFGLIIAYNSRALFVNSFIAMAAIGVAYGWALHRCAAAGLLIWPEDLA